MRAKLILIVIAYLAAIAAMVATSSMSHAGVQSKPGQVKASLQPMAKETAARLSTNMNFAGSKVGGQYQVPGEGTARVENEKPIEELLGLRTQFRDRIKQDEERE